jgi:VWFA-related protein
MSLSKSALIVLALTAVSAAQQPTFHTEANYIRVDVYATDIHGVPIRDLKQDDFEIFDDGQPQKVAAFQHIEIQTGTPQDLRHDPNNVADMRAQMNDPNARVFALFLDITHVTVGQSHEMRQPLTDMLDHMIGQNDLIGVMTPRMSAKDVTFARKTNTIESFITKYWDWGESGNVIVNDPVERNYEMCYPGIIKEDCCTDPQCTPEKMEHLSDAGYAQEMILRRRESMALDSLEELIHYLGAVREERSAVVLVSPGWSLFQPNSRLARPLHCNEAPGKPTIGVDPNGGKLTNRPPAGGGAFANISNDCERDRLNLAQIDDVRRFQRIPDMANRANVSFYPIDPGGLRAGTSAGENRAIENHLDTLRVLANDTDGLAVVNTNDLDKGVQRLTADLSSYYLLGYYSTNMKFDGKFHSIKVRVNRSGIQIRNRRGYLAPSPGETRAAEAAAGSPLSIVTATEDRALSDALKPLAESARDASLHVQLVAGWTPSNAGRVWVVGELDPKEDVMTAGDADVTLMDRQGMTIATAKAHMEPRVRSFRATLAPTVPIEPGEYTVRVTAKRDAGVEPPRNEVARVTFPLAPDTWGAVFIRRGQSTGNREVATADARFRRNETIRIEVPTTASVAGAARLLDRQGKPLAIPLTSALRDDPDGSRWQTAQLTLAPLGFGDYIVELTAGAGEAGRSEKRTLIAFRIIP